jgi:hypothetical protein
MNKFAEYRPDTGKLVETNSCIALSVNNENLGTVDGRIGGIDSCSW